jgi:hypothetical protein
MREEMIASQTLRRNMGKYSTREVILPKVNLPVMESVKA